MTLSVSDFRAATARMGENDTVKLKGNEKEIAVSWYSRAWASIKSWFTAPAKNAQTEFIDAVKREYGPHCADIAAEHLRAELDGKPLTARAVSDALATIDGMGGKNWAKTERLALELSGREPLAELQTGDPEKAREDIIQGQGGYGALRSLESNRHWYSRDAFSPASDRLTATARKAHIDESAVDEVRKEFEADRLQETLHGYSNLKLSDAVASAIRSAGAVEQNGTTTYREVGPEEASAIAEKVVYRAMRQRLNEKTANTQLDQVHFDRLYRAEMENFDIPAHDFDAAGFRARFMQKVAALPHVAEEMEVRQLLNAEMTKHCEMAKLRRAASFELSTGGDPAANAALYRHMPEDGMIGPRGVTAAARISYGISFHHYGFDGATPDEQISRALEMGKMLSSHMSNSGAVSEQALTLGVIGYVGREAHVSGIPEFEGFLQSKAGQDLVAEAERRANDRSLDYSTRDSYAAFVMMARKIPELHAEIRGNAAS